jgi:hypothetical protein
MNDYSQWDEFRWEKELRKYENKVSEYFSKLIRNAEFPGIDEPGSFSQEITAGEKNNSPAKNISNWLKGDFDDDDAAGEDEIYEPRRQVCLSGVDALDQLAAEWNIFISEHIPEISGKDAAAVSTAFAKALARVADFSEPAEGCPPALLIALGKRSIVDLEDIVSRLLDFQQHCPFSSEQVKYMLPRISIIREQMTDRLWLIRKQMKPGTI